MESIGLMSERYRAAGKDAGWPEIAGAGISVKLLQQYGAEYVFGRSGAAAVTFMQKSERPSAIRYTLELNKISAWR